MLRRLHLDELPQIVNVLRGEMSLVGPRPERPALAMHIERELPGFAERLRVRPGIMGLAQALDSYHWPPRNKLYCDNLYIAHMSPWLDIRLCLLCLRRVLRSSRRHPSRALQPRSEGLRRPLVWLPEDTVLRPDGPAPGTSAPGVSAQRIWR